MDTTPPTSTVKPLPRDHDPPASPSRSPAATRPGPAAARPRESPRSPSTTRPTADRSRSSRPSRRPPRRRRSPASRPHLRLLQRGHRQCRQRPADPDRGPADRSDPRADDRQLDHRRLAQSAKHAVSSIDVTFSLPINPAASFGGAVTLTDNGGPVLSPAPSPLTSSRARPTQISGLAGLTTAEGVHADRQRRRHPRQTATPGTGSLPPRG